MITSGGDPGHFTELLHQAGAGVLHVVSSVRRAQKAESCKADALIVEGVEAAAYVGFDEIPQRRSLLWILCRIDQGDPFYSGSDSKTGR